jgi:hypothetical protein
MKAAVLTSPADISTHPLKICDKPLPTVKRVMFFYACARVVSAEPICISWKENFLLGAL